MFSLLKKHNEKKKKVENLMSFFSTPMTEEEVAAWNLSNYTVSEGLIAKGHTEYDIKMRELFGNVVVFSNREYQKAKNLIRNFKS